MTREQLKQAIQNYLTILRPKLEGRSPSWKIDARSSGTAGKGRRAAPWERGAFTLMDRPDNAYAAKKVDAILEDFAAYYTGERPFIYKQCIAAAQEDPGLLRQWREGKTEDSRRLARIFDRAIDYVAQEYERRHPGEELEVHVDLRDLPVRTGREAQQKDTEALDAEILAELEAIEHEEGLSRTEAKELLADRSGGLYTVRRIQRAIAGPEGREKERERDRRRDRKKREAAA